MGDNVHSTFHSQLEPQSLEPPTPSRKSGRKQFSLPDRDIIRLANSGGDINTEPLMTTRRMYPEKVCYDQLEMPANRPVEGASVYGNGMDRMDGRRLYNTEPMYTVTPPWWTAGAAPSAPLGTTTKRRGPSNRFTAPSPF